jgi:excisionase family DNA binding protein
MTTAHPTHAAVEPPAGATVSGQEPTVLSVAETAALLGVSEWLVLQQVRLGTLPHKRCGRRIVFSRERLLAWLAAE